MTNHTAGPDFVAFQVRNVEASARFYEEVVGLHRLPAPNPAAAVFSTGPGSSFAVRTPLPGVDLEAGTPLGTGSGCGSTRRTPWPFMPVSSQLAARSSRAHSKDLSEPSSPSVTPMAIS